MGKHGSAIIHAGLAKLLLTCLLMIVGVLTATVPPATAAPGPNRRLVAVIPASFRPTYFQDKNGKPAGFAVDVMNEIARRMNMTVEFTYGKPWDEMIDMVANGKADLIPSLTPSPDRVAKLAFTAPIERVPVNLIVSGDSSIRKITPGMKIGTIKASLPEAYLRKQSSIEPQLYDDLDRLLFDLLAGHIDAAFTLTPNLMLLATEAGVDEKIKVVSPSLWEAKRAIAVRKDDQELITKLNEVIEPFVDSPEYRTIYLKWYGRQTPYWTARRVATAMGGTFLVILGILALARYRYVTTVNRELTENIIEREQAEAALHESREQLSLLLSSTAEGIYGVDLNGVCTFANPSCVRMLGYSSPDELLGSNMHNLIHHTRPDGTAFPAESCCLLRVIRDGKGCHIDDELFWRADGTSFIAEYWSYPMIHNENLVGAVITFLDITVRKEVELEINRLNTELEQRVDERTAQLEAANQELESFAYSVSHDLRAPLRHMSGFSRMIIEDFRTILPEEAVDYLERIEQAGNKMGYLIDALLQLSHISRAELSLQMVNLSKIARELIAEFQQAAPERHVTVELVDDLTAMADPILMRVAMQNLLGNAWKYTRDISPACISFFAEEKNGTRFFCIRDNGTGFDMAYADKLFNAFQRLHGAEYEGTGIGLATVQRIINRHGGQVRAESEPGKGACFCFTLS